MDQEIRVSPGLQTALVVFECEGWLGHMDDQMGYGDAPDCGGADASAAQDWVVVKFPDRAKARAARTRVEELSEGPLAGLEATRLFDHLSILSNYCYGQGHLGLYEKFEQLALDLGRAMHEVAETFATVLDEPTPRSSAGGADEYRGRQRDLFEVRARANPVDHGE